MSLTYTTKKPTIHIRDGKVDTIIFKLSGLCSVTNASRDQTHRLVIAAPDRVPMSDFTTESFDALYTSAIDQAMKDAMEVYFSQCQDGDDNYTIFDFDSTTL